MFQLHLAKIGPPLPSEVGGAWREQTSPEPRRSKPCTFHIRCLKNSLLTEGARNPRIMDMSLCLVCSAVSMLPLEWHLSRGDTGI